MSHYLGAFTTVRARLQQAVCGAFIREHEHSNEPSCEKCQAYLAREADADAALFLALGYVEVRPGVMGPRTGPLPIAFGSKPEP